MKRVPLTMYRRITKVPTAAVTFGFGRLNVPLLSKDTLLSGEPYLSRGGGEGVGGVTFGIPRRFKLKLRHFLPVQLRPVWSLYFSSGQAKTRMHQLR